MPQINECRKCAAPILPVIGRGLVTYMFGQTLGVKPRRKTSALAICHCARCAVSLALKPGPHESDYYNLSAYQIMRNLCGTERPETQQAFARIFELVIEREGQLCDREILAQLPEPEIILPRRSLKAAI